MNRSVAVDVNMIVTLNLQSCDLLGDFIEAIGRDGTVSAGERNRRHDDASKIDQRDQPRDAASCPAVRNSKHPITAPDLACPRASPANSASSGVFKQDRSQAKGCRTKGDLGVQARARRHAADLHRAGRLPGRLRRCRLRDDHVPVVSQFEFPSGAQDVDSALSREGDSRPLLMSRTPLK